MKDRPRQPSRGSFRKAYGHLPWTDTGPTPDRRSHDVSTLSDALYINGSGRHDRRDRYFCILLPYKQSRYRQRC